MVDDDEIDRLMTVSYVKRSERLCLIAAFSSAEEAYNEVDFSEIDVVFLDIEMGNQLDGISFRKMLKEVPACIFITSFPEFAVDSFEVDTLDYLLKPVKSERFEEAVNRIQLFMEIREKVHLYENLVTQDSVFIKEGNKEIKIGLHEVLYLEALKDYTLLVTENKKYCILCSLGNMLKKINFAHFIRIHKSYAVRKDLVKSISSKNLMLQNNTFLPIGRSFKETLVHIIKE